jgi:hypothetical protein
MNEIRPRPDWRQRLGTPAAILMFLIAIGVLIWAAIKYFAVMIFGGSIAEVWPLVAVSVLIFLVGWDFLPGTGRNAESQPTSKPASPPEVPSKPK